MGLSRIESLDLRPHKVIRAEKRQQEVEGRGWWADWDDIFPSRIRSINVGISLSGMQAFNEAMKSIARAAAWSLPPVRTVALGREWGEMYQQWERKWYPPRARFRAPWHWYWGRILFTLGVTFAVATIIYMEVIAWL